MPNSAYEDAIKEAFALAPSNVAYLETLSVSHPALPTGTLYLVKDRVDHDFTLEDGTTVRTFKACGFTLKLPTVGDSGVEDIQIAIDDIDNQVSDFVNAVYGSEVSVVVTFRPYLSNDPTKCQMVPPLSLALKDVVVTNTQVTGRATLADTLNRPFLNDLYTRQRFPSLGNTG